MNPIRAVILKMSESDSWRRRLTNWGTARRVVSRFIPGEHLDDAVRAVTVINEGGARASLNPLGEHVENAAMAEAAANTYLGIVERIGSGGLDSNVSVKLTMLGLDLDRNLAIGHLKRILSAARTHGTSVRIDMESSAYVDGTLAIYEELHDEFPNLGLVIQSYLKRSAEDIERLIPLGAAIRLVKGAYKEPPDVAFPKKSDVDRSFANLLERLLDPDARESGVELAVATHDPVLVNRAEELLRQRGIDSGVEFQFLYGIRRDVQRQIIADGFALRVYVSYGPSWYPWFMRRLAERPANLTFFLRHLLR
jgi:proline dehydrogenase